MKELKNIELIEYYGGSMLSNEFWEVLSYLFHAQAEIESYSAAGGGCVNYK